jgi:hypothetical protein
MAGQHLPVLSAFVRLDPLLDVSWTLLRLQMKDPSALSIRPFNAKTSRPSTGAKSSACCDDIQVQYAGHL